MKYFPIVSGHGVFTGPDVITQLAADQYSRRGHFVRVQSTRVQEPVNGIRSPQDLKLAGGIGPRVLDGIGK